MAKLEYIYEIWQNYSKTRQELEDLLKEKFNVEVLATKLESEEEQSETMCLQVCIETNLKLMTDIKMCHVIMSPLRTKGDIVLV
jgi:hypothetical protein